MNMLTDYVFSTGCAKRYTFSHIGIPIDKFHNVILLAAKELPNLASILWKNCRQMEAMIQKL